MTFTDSTSRTDTNTWVLACYFLVKKNTWRWEVEFPAAGTLCNLTFDYICLMLEDRFDEN